LKQGELAGFPASLLKIGIDVRFHKSRHRDRKRLITITASHQDEGIDEPRGSASAASEKWERGQGEGPNDVEHDDQANASEPPGSETLAPSTDAAGASEPGESDQPGATPSKVTPQVADAADAEIRGTNVEFVGYIPGTRIRILRYRTRNKAKKLKKSPGHRG